MPSVSGLLGFIASKKMVTIGINDILQNINGEIYIFTYKVIFEMKMMLDIDTW